MRPPGGLAARSALAGSVGLLLLSLAVFLFVRRPLIAVQGTPTQRQPRPFAIPAGATQFGSLADFEEAVLRPGIPFALAIPEPELNRRIAAAIAKQPDLPFHDPVARLLDEQAEFTGGVRVLGLDLAPTVTVRLWADRGELRYEITGITFGPVRLPGVARRAISDTVRRQLDQQRLAERYLIDDLQIRPGVVTIVARVK